MWRRILGLVSGLGTLTQRRTDGRSFRALCLTLALSVSALIILATSGAPAIAQQPAGQPAGQAPPRTARISNVEGGVQVSFPDNTASDQATLNMPAVEGSRLQTAGDGRAEIEFEDGAVARLTPNSSLKLDELSRNSDGSTISRLEVLSGLVYFEAGADRKQQYSILFGNNVVTPSETSTFRVNLDAAPVELAVLQGSVQAANGNAYSVDVHEGETARFGADGARYLLAQGVSPDSWDQWNIDRDQALDAMAAQQPAGNVSDGAGWSDLNYYGDWYSVPGYGEVWAPNGVDASWDPYGNGSWGYYPGVGYTWISGNPWGWLPYHCGNWTFLNGYGWLWVPGNCNTWCLYNAGIWNAPAYYRLPQRPHPVGPRDNLPHHNHPVTGGNRPPRNIFTPAASGPVNAAPRNLVVDGRVITPLPKTPAEEPSRMITYAGPTSYAAPTSYTAPTSVGSANVAPTNGTLATGTASVVQTSPLDTELYLGMLGPAYGGQSQAFADGNRPQYESFGGSDVSQAGASSSQPGARPLYRPSPTVPAPTFGRGNVPLPAPRYPDPRYTAPRLPAPRYTPAPQSRSYSAPASHMSAPSSGSRSSSPASSGRGK